MAGRGWCLCPLLFGPPNVKQPGFKWITAGGLLAVLVWLIASGLFAVYGVRAQQLGTSLSGRLWITNIAILLGAEFNAESQRQRAIQGGLSDHVEPFAELRDTSKLDDVQTERVEQADRARSARPAPAAASLAPCTCDERRLDHPHRGAPPAHVDRDLVALADAGVGRDQRQADAHLARG